jgi:hypothetical protein
VGGFRSRGGFNERALVRGREGGRGKEAAASSAKEMEDSGTSLLVRGPGLGRPPYLVTKPIVKRPRGRRAR